jgi:glycosyl transferase family 25
MSEHLRASIVSLARSSERRRVFGAQAASVGLDYEYFDAVDALDSHAHALDAAADADALRRNAGRDLGPREKACAESHRKLYAALAQSAQPGLLVLEDDVTVTPELEDVVRFFENHARGFQNEKWLFILGGREGFEDRVMVLSRRNRLRISDGLSFRKVVISHHALQRTCGYYITRAAAAGILEAEKKISHVADAWDFRLRNKTLDAVWLASRPVISHPVDPLSSLIHAERTYFETIQQRVPLPRRSKLRRLLSRVKATVKAALARALVYPVIAFFR